MSKDPAFLFYPGDWLGGTMTFSRAHKGAYMDLLMVQFNQGRLQLEDVKTILGVDFELMWESKLKKKFKIDENGLYYNVKLENEVIRRRKFTESRRDNLTHKASRMEPHKASLMETETRTETRTINRTEIKTVNTVEDKIPYDEIVAYLNLKVGSKYKPSAGNTKQLIHARWEEGFLLEDFKRAIDNKCADWLNDRDMVKYLRPDTLFSKSKFQGYVNQQRTAGDKLGINNQAAKMLEHGMRIFQEENTFDASANKTHPELLQKIEGEIIDVI